MLPVAPILLLTRLAASISSQHPAQRRVVRIFLATVCVFVFAGGMAGCGRALHDHQGRLKRRISVVVTHPRGPMHIVSGMLYLSSLSGDCPIGAIVNGRLEPVLDPDRVMPQRGLEGIVGRTSGLLYSTQTTDHTVGLIDISDRAGNPVRTIRIADPALVSIVFLQEDDAGHIYVQIERTDPENRGVVLEVHKFDPRGTLVCRIPIPEHNYQTHTVKLLDVAADGAIYQFIPMYDGSQLNRFSPQQ